ncbi:MAG: response regulator [Acidimicrobiales bacterium]
MDDRPRGATVVLVERPTVARHALARELRARGHRLFVADTAEHGLYLLLRYGVDLVVCSDDLAGMSFEPLVAELQARGGPPAVVLTAGASARDRARVVEEGAALAVPRGLEPVAVAAHCGAVLRRTRGVVAAVR